MAALSEGEAAEIDAFLREEKRLDGPHPIWHEASRPGEMSAVWDVQDSLDITRAALRLRCSLETLAWPSVSLVFHRNAIWRIDLVPVHESKPNPLGAAALKLPAGARISCAHLVAQPRLSPFTGSLGFALSIASGRPYTQAGAGRCLIGERR
jgi:hypothetical protein